MKYLLNVHGYGLIQDCYGLINGLKKQGFSYDEFLHFVEKAKKENLDLSEKKAKKKGQELKETNKIFLKIGEPELMYGVVCSKCKGEVYIEGICCKNSLVKQGFVRKGICGSCGIEFGIR